MSNDKGYALLKGEKNFLVRLLGQAVSRFGDSVDQIAFAWLMYEITGSASMLAFILFFNFLPNIAFQPFSGVLVERFSKKRVLVICDVGRAVLVVIAIVLYLFGCLNVLFLILLTLCVSTLESFKLPASSAVVPYLLPKEKFGVGVALNTTVTRASELIGRGAAGIFLAVFGIPVSLAIDAASFLISAGINLRMKIEEVRPAEPLTPKLYFSQLADGAKQLWKRKNVLAFVLLSAFMNFMLSPTNSYESAYAADCLRFGPEALSVMGVAISLGITLGSLISPKLPEQMGGRRMLVMFGVLMAACYVGLWLLPDVQSYSWRMMLLAVNFFIFGLSIGVPSVRIGARIMEAVPPEYLARINGFSGAIQTSMIPVGALLCSGLALLIPVPVVYLLFAVVILLLYGGALFVKAFDEL